MVWSLLLQIPLSPSLNLSYTELMEMEIDKFFEFFERFASILEKVKPPSEDRGTGGP